MRLQCDSNNSLLSQGTIPLFIVAVVLWQFAFQPTVLH